MALGGPSALRLRARDGGEPVDDHVAVARIELEPVAAAPEHMGRNESAARTGEGVEHQIAASRAVLEAPADELHGLRRRMIPGSRRARDFEDRVLSVPPVPPACSASEATASGRVAVEDRLVPIV